MVVCLMLRVEDKDRIKLIGLLRGERRRLEARRVRYRQGENRVRT